MSSNELGEGTYTAKVTCKNYAFESDTKTVSFNIGTQVIPEEPDSSDTDQNVGNKEDTTESNPGEKEDNTDPNPDDKDNITLEEPGDQDISDSDSEEPDDMEEGDIFQDDSGNAEYEVIAVKGNTVCVEYTENTNPKASVIRIPATIEAADGTICKVTSVAGSAFRKNKKIKKVFVGSNVETIGANAFYGCKSLKKLTVKTTRLTSKGLGKKAWKGIQAKASVRVPAGKQKTYQKLFYKKGMSRKIKIK